MPSDDKKDMAARPRSNSHCYGDSPSLLLPDLDKTFDKMSLANKTGPSVNDSWLSRLSNTFSITSNVDSSVGSKAAADDSQLPKPDASTSALDEPMSANERLRRGSLDIERMQKEAAEDAKKKRKYQNFHITKWLISNAHPDMVRISESSELSPLEANQSKSVPEGSTSSPVGAGLTDAVKSAGLSSAASQLEPPKPSGKRRLSLRELNAVAPSGF